MSTSQHFEHSFHALGSEYVTPTAATPVSAPKWLAWNNRLAEQLGWPEAWGHNEQTLITLAGNGQFEGSQPGSAAYAGHQFGNYNPQLGDGRAILLANGDVQMASSSTFSSKAQGPHLTLEEAMAARQLGRWCGNI